VTLARYQLREAEGQKSLTLGGSASFTDNSVSGGAPLSGTITIPGTEVTGLPFTATGLSGSPATQWNFALTLKYPLYTGGALEAQIEIARANVAVAEAQFSGAAQQIVLSARQAYYGVQQSQGTIEAAQRSVEAARENVRVTDARVRAGTSPQFDLLQAQVQLAQSEQALTRATTALAQAQQSLAAVLFLPLGTTVAPGTPLGLPQPPNDVEALIKQALENRPEIAQVRASQAASRAAISLAEAGLKPNVTASGGPAITTSDPTNKAVVNFTATISVTIAILDGGVTEARVNQAKTRLQQAEVSEEQTKQQVELDVRNAFLTLRDAADQLRSALAQQTAAREALRIANVRFQAGVGLQLEVVTAVQNLATADNNVVQAVFQYNVALALLDRAIGVQVKL
jgi:outer membrane protein TolC